MPPIHHDLFCVLYLQDTAGVVADMVDDMGNNLKGIAPDGIGDMMNKLF